jgi:hypothetical protein
MLHGTIHSRLSSRWILHEFELQYPVEAKSLWTSVPNLASANLSLSTLPDLTEQLLCSRRTRSGNISLTHPGVLGPPGSGKLRSSAVLANIFPKLTICHIMRRLPPTQRAKGTKIVKPSQPYKSHSPDPSFISATRICRNEEILFRYVMSSRCTDQETRDIKFVPIF